VGVKHLNRLDQVLGASEANVQGYVDGLMFNSKGFLVESTCANIFLRTEEHGWLTPSIETAGINGVMRSLLIHEIFPQVYFSLATFPIESEMLCDVTELFICNSARGIVPVTAVRGKKGDSTMRIGNETRALQSKLSELYKCYK
jgi:4-amino-4-deoxychorismate lyase